MAGKGKKSEQRKKLVKKLAKKVIKKVKKEEKKSNDDCGCGLVALAQMTALR